MDELLVCDIGNQIIYQVTMFRVFFEAKETESVLQTANITQIRFI